MCRLDHQHPSIAPLVNRRRAYSPDDYSQLVVSSEVQQVFSHITFYTPQIVDIELRLKPFIPEYIPAVGDIDSFVKVGAVCTPSAGGLARTSG